MMELDRTYSHVWTPKAYYVDSFPLCFLGAYNTAVRATVPHHRHILPLDYFPEHSLLEQNYLSIRSEALNIYKNYDLPKFHEVNAAFNRISDDKWKVFVLKWYDGMIATNCEKCPITASLLEQCPNVHAAMFSILAPHKHIVPHRGPNTSSLRYHLGLAIPASGDVFIRVNGERYDWKEGEGVLFDDCYEHEVYNNSDEVRIVLFLDVERPIPGTLGRFNRFLNTECGKFTQFVNDVNKKAEVMHDNYK